MCTKRTGELLWEKHTEGIKLQSLVITSEDSYFYDYNAVKAAKVKIDELFH